MTIKKLLTILIVAGVTGIVAVSFYVAHLASTLPEFISIEDYKPLLVSEVYDRNGQKIGEFFREKRLLVAYEEVPEHVIQAFISAEDSSFFEHGGVNFVAIARAMIANIRAGRKVQGGSTITQQVARSLVLTREKTYTRKIKEVILSYRMEDTLSKQQIMWLYLNQIYLGQGTYGVAIAAQVYFRKELKDITVGEAALLAGLPQAPSRYSPVYNPSSAKARQRYVLKRMAEEGFITEEQAQAEVETAVNVYVRKKFDELAPFYLETVRQMLVEELGEEAVLDQGLKIYTSLDLPKQLEAQKQLRKGLRSLDKRQGFRGVLGNITEPQEVAEFLLKERNRIMDELSPLRILQPDGTIPEKPPLDLTETLESGERKPTLPEYIKTGDLVKGIVTGINDKWGLVTVRFAETKGMIDFETMEWARKPNPKVRADNAKIKTASEALKKGDIIEISVKSKKFFSSRINKELSELRKKLRKQKKDYERPEELPDFSHYARVELEQEPIAEASLLSLDQRNQDVIAMVGGYDFKRSKFNRALQATRQTGSAFKSMVFASALDKKEYTPVTPITDAPVVFEEEDKSAEEIEAGGGAAPQEVANTDPGESEAEDVATKKWKPMNHSNKFLGDILFRNALIRSLNVPTVKVIEQITVNWVATYARRLGIFSPLNMDYTLALGSSGVTLYEMTKVFSQFGRLGRKIKPRIISKVESNTGEVLVTNMTLDQKFKEQIAAIDDYFEPRRRAYLRYKRTGKPTAINYPKKEIQEEETPEETAQLKNQPTEENADAPEKAYDYAGAISLKKDRAPAQTQNEELEGEEVKKEYDRFVFNEETVKSEPPLYFKSSLQLIRPETAYVTTTLLKGVVEEPRGTAGRARSLGRPVAGKTGTTNGYFDGWFMGYSADIATGVWVGYDQERSLGVGEVGGKAALPIWLEYMKFAHQGMPERKFRVPNGIVFANIDNKTGRLASANSDQVVRQAFIEGTEPTKVEDESTSETEQDFFKEELTE